MMLLGAASLALAACDRGEDLAPVAIDNESNLVVVQEDGDNVVFEEGREVDTAQD